MIISILKWAVKVPTLLFLDLFVFLFSPIICLFVTTAEESETTGFPSLFPGKQREFLIKPLRLLQTFDAPLDEWWYANYYPNGYFKRTFDQEYFESHWWLRYCCRILWLCRNPAYGFGLALGYDSNGSTEITTRDNSNLWNKETHSSFWKVKNAKGEIGWWYKSQWFYTKTRCVALNLGYKLDSDTPNGNKMVAMQFHPCRKIIRK